MKFSEIRYERPNLDEIKAQLTALTQRLTDAASYDEARAAFLEKDRLNRHVDTAATFVSIRHSIDTRDAFFDAEETFWNENVPELQAYLQKWTDALLQSKFRPDFEKEFGAIIFTKAEMELKTFSPEIIPELRGDSLPALRNDEIPYAHYTKDIRKDSLWMQALEAQAFLRTATMKMMLHAEVDRLKAGKPLYRDQQAEIRFAQRCQQEVENLKTRMRNHEKTMKEVREKAEKYGKTLEKALDDDAIWLIRQKYGLDRCRLIDDPDAEIPLPIDFL